MNNIDHLVIMLGDLGSWRSGSLASTTHLNTAASVTTGHLQRPCVQASTGERATHTLGRQLYFVVYIKNKVYWGREISVELSL